MGDLPLFVFFARLSRHVFFWGEGEGRAACMYVSSIALSCRPPGSLDRVWGRPELYSVGWWDGGWG